MKPTGGHFGNITARNYAGQAHAGLADFIEATYQTHGGNPDYLPDLTNVVLMRASIERAEHFAMPDGGILFDDKLKGLRGEPARMPYPHLTLEYHQHAGPDDEGFPAPKRVVIVSEFENLAELRQVMTSPKYQAERAGLFGNAEEIHDFDRLAVFGTETPLSFITACYFASAETVKQQSGGALVRGMWVPDPVGWIMPATWDDPGRPDLNGSLGSEVQKRLDEMSQADQPGIVGCPFSVMPASLAYMERESGTDPAEFRAGLIQDITGEVRSLLELCEALSCSNVEIDVLHKAPRHINEKRRRKGKLPIFETKTLFLEAPAHTVRAGSVQHGDRASPRQHLRRGHVRRLQDGRRVWVNSCVVGDPELGRIDKQYEVAAG